MNKADFYLNDLKSKFEKINPEEYYLSYSGGKDSHLIYWFLKVWLANNDFKMWLNFRKIKIVGVNTRMEHPEILRRILDNSDVILLPKKKPFEIKDLYGIPCFSKQQDEYIKRYQNGSRSKNTMNVVLGNNVKFNLNNKASYLLLTNNLHKISGKCCDYLKKKPSEKYRKKTGLKAILGVRSNESMLRSTQYTGCFKQDGTFTPLHDLTNDIENDIYSNYDIPVPKVYDHIQRTGCMGCPYGKNTKIELDLLPKNRRNYVIKYFKESYDVLGIDYSTQQTRLDI